MGGRGAGTGRRAGLALVVVVVLLLAAAQPGGTVCRGGSSSPLSPSPSPPPLPLPVNGVHRILVPTIPRSGNGWFRGLVEAATGLDTQSVFPVSKSRFDNRTHAYRERCGWLKDCVLVPPPGPPHDHDRDPAVVKTHFPFTSHMDVAALLGRGVSDAGRASYLVLPVRNPLDNYEAWTRYVDERVVNKTGAAHTGLRDFVRAWITHHNFWFSQGVPSAVYRYEDLVSDPIRVLTEVLKLSGLWDLCDLSDMDLLRVSNVSQLQAYTRKQIGAQTRKKDDMSKNFRKFDAADIEWILSEYGPVLQRYGYDRVYEIWLRSKEGKLTEEQTLAMVKATMDSSATFANWGESWTAVSKVAQPA